MNNLKHEIMNTLGMLPKTIHALFFLIVLDYITGICVAVKEQKLSSQIGSKGIASKVMTVSLVALSFVIDTFIIANGTTFTSLTILFYCSNELISIIENANRFGVSLPKKLKEYILEITKHNK